MRTYYLTARKNGRSIAPKISSGKYIKQTILVTYFSNLIGQANLITKLGKQFYDSYVILLSLQSVNKKSLKVAWGFFKSALTSI